MTVHGVGYGFLESTANDLAAAAEEWATELVGLNAKRASALIGKTLETTPDVQVQLHGVGSEIQYLGCYKDDDDEQMEHSAPTGQLTQYSVRRCLAYVWIGIAKQWSNETCMIRQCV